MRASNAIPSRSWRDRASSCSAAWLRSMTRSPDSDGDVRHRRQLVQRAEPLTRRDQRLVPAAQGAVGPLEPAVLVGQRQAGAVRVRTSRADARGQRLRPGTPGPVVTTPITHRPLLAAYRGRRRVSLRPGTAQRPSPSGHDRVTATGTGRPASGARARLRRSGRGRRASARAAIDSGQGPLSIVAGDAQQAPPGVDDVVHGAGPGPGRMRRRWWWWRRHPPRHARRRRQAEAAGSGGRRRRRLRQAGRPGPARGLRSGRTRRRWGSTRPTTRRRRSCRTRCTSWPTATCTSSAAEGGRVPGHLEKGSARWPCAAWPRCSPSSSSAWPPASTNLKDAVALLDVSKGVGLMYLVHHQTSASRA